MNISGKNSNDNIKPALALPTQITLTVAAIGFAVGSSLDPLGLVGILLAVLSSAMLVVLTLGVKSVPGAPLTFLNAPISYIASAYIFTFIKGEPLEAALVLSLGALYPAVMALPIYLTVASRKGRSVSIAASALSAFVLWAAYIALRLWLASGTVSLELLGEMIDTAFEPARAALESLTFDHGEEVIRYYSDADIDSMLYSVKTMLIGSAAAGFIVISYLTTLATRLIAGCFELEGRLPSSTRIRMKLTPTEEGVTAELSKDTVPWRIELDSVSAFVMIGAYIFSILFTSDAGMSGSSTLPAAITAQNLLLILLPGFIYAGARDIFGGSSSPASIGRGCIIMPLSFVLIFINPLTLAVLLAIIGVSSVLRENRARSRAEHFIENQGLGTARTGEVDRSESDSVDINPQSSEASSEKTETGFENTVSDTSGTADENVPVDASDGSHTDSSSDASDDSHTDSGSDASDGSHTDSSSDASDDSHTDSGSDASDASNNDGTDSRN